MLQGVIQQDQQYLMQASTVGLDADIPDISIKLYTLLFTERLKMTLNILCKPLQIDRFKIEFQLSDIQPREKQQVFHQTAHMIAFRNNIIQQIFHRGLFAVFRSAASEAARISVSGARNSWLALAMNICWLSHDFCAEGKHPARLPPAHESEQDNDRTANN